MQGYPAVRPKLDPVEQEDQYTHELSLEDEIAQEIGLDIFKPDPQFLEHEKAYEDLKKDIIGDKSTEEEGSGAASDSEDDEESDEEEENKKIKDQGRRLSSVATLFQHLIMHVVQRNLIADNSPWHSGSQERTYLRYYGLLGQRFCMINKAYQENFETCFVNQYSMIHCLETNKLRNVAKFFPHLLGTDALPWHVLSYICLTEEDTTSSSSRIFIKILFQELSEHLGIRLLDERLNDWITESLREYLKKMPRLIMQQQKPVSESDNSGSSSTSSSGCCWWVGGGGKIQFCMAVSSQVPYSVSLALFPNVLPIRFERLLAAEALRRNEIDTQRALDDLTNPEKNAVVQQYIESKKRKRPRQALEADIEVLKDQE
ncbi:hypothetical protein MRB53_013810 [Persea americana]|uniref:Uncharacterized protein n=1 Tax=Persea americana TaxID=3435 RepID=A0ACC2K9J6_PERAE|nr:hypothetical protein MRB53_013810 [Persea americana]